jgi:hypothetical protein
MAYGQAGNMLKYFQYMIEGIISQHEKMARLPTPVPGVFPSTSPTPVPTPGPAATLTAAPVASPVQTTSASPSSLSPFAAPFSPRGRNKEQRWIDSSPASPAGGSPTKPSSAMRFWGEHSSFPPPPQLPRWRRRLLQWRSRLPARFF